MRKKCDLFFIIFKQFSFSLNTQTTKPIMGSVNCKAFSSTKTVQDNQGKQHIFFSFNLYSDLFLLSNLNFFRCDSGVNYDPICMEYSFILISNVTNVCFSAVLIRFEWDIIIWCVCYCPDIFEIKTIISSC